MFLRFCMKVCNVISVAVGILMAGPVSATQLPSLEKIAAECAPGIHPATLKGIVSTESSWNTYAIGVVNGMLTRQPRNLAEAVATAYELERKGFNFSMGLAQVNRYNLSRYGETYETVFEPCRNLRVGGSILKECFERAKTQFANEQQALRAAFSCYYSGNFMRGRQLEKPGQASYVEKVVANATDAIPVVPAVQHESSDAVTVRPVAPSKPAPWVIFNDSKQQRNKPLVTNNSEATEEPSASGARDTPFVQFVD